MDSLKLLKKNYPFLLSMYYRAQTYAAQSDIGRICILDTYGGIYVDSDIYLIKDITPLIKNTSFFAGEREDSFISQAILGISICNALLGSIPKHPILYEIINGWKNTSYNPGKSPVFTTGPVYITAKIRKIKKRNPSLLITVYPPHVFYPTTNHPKSYTVHRGLGSWCNKYSVRNKCWFIALFFFIFLLASIYLFGFTLY